MTKTLIFAHRGANREAAENTRAAFDKALEYAIDGIETDVQLSRDEVPVLWHDRFLDKVGLPAKHVDDFDYAQLQAMNFAAHFSSNRHSASTTPKHESACASRFPHPNLPPLAGEGTNELLRDFHVKAEPEGIMTLQAFMDVYRKRCRLLIEIKNRTWESLSRHEIKVRQTLKMAGVVNGVAHNDDVMVSSFNLSSLAYAHRYSPGFPLVYNLEPEQTLEDARRALIEQPFLHGLCLPIDSLNDWFVRLLHNHDKCIAVYTCNSDEEISRALESGVNILISDVPQKALQMRGG